MRTPLSWISLYTPLDTLLQKYTTSELAHSYSTHTAEIDAREEYFIDRVVVAKILSCEKHPESKKLSIVRVDQGIHGEETILTGAENIQEATYVAVAMIGSVLPGDFIIAERPMAGMLSRGMICSEDELGLAHERSSGIMILENFWDTDLLEKMVGRLFFDLTLPFPGRKGAIHQFPLRDTTFEIDNKFITNRPDLFSIVGNAREWHAVYEQPIFLDGESFGVDTEEGNIAPIDTQQGRVHTKFCLSYHTMRMENIQVENSPFGISLMMERAGITPKMDIVDITNLIMTELGQPMHAFDADKIVGYLCVRQAKKGEKILSLNGSEYELTSDDMIIADDRGPVALAGIIGGMDSAVSLETKNILWESACFDATSVRLSAQRHGIRTDASTRYEKSLDPLLAGTTFSRVIEYMQFLGKNISITSISRYLDESQVRHITIDMDYTDIDTRAGISIPPAQTDALLERLGFQIIRRPEDRNNDSTRRKMLSVNVPSWRATKDIKIKEDIIEEVIRVYGYDRIPLHPLSGLFSISKKSHDENIRNNTVNHFSHAGWNEAYTYSFSNAELEKKIFHEDLSNMIEIENASSEELTHMRHSLAPRLFQSASENTKYAKSFTLYEIGKVYLRGDVSHESASSPSENENMHTLEEYLLTDIAHKPFPEKKKIAGVMVGGSIESVRTVIEGWLKNLLSYTPIIETGTSLSFLHPNKSGHYLSPVGTLGEIGVIHPAVAEYFGLPNTTIFFEIDFRILKHLSRENDMRFVSLSRYQTIPRELNFVMDARTPTGEVARTLDALHPWITGVHVDSIYEEEEKIGTGKKSVNFGFTLMNHDATISDEEALAVQTLIITEMGKKGYFLRT